MNILISFKIILYIISKYTNMLISKFALKTYCDINILILKFALIKLKSHIENFMINGLNFLL